MAIVLDRGLGWRDVARIAEGESLSLSPDAWARVEKAALIVERIVESGVRAYGINTGVGALSDTVVSRDQQAALSRHILFSHATGVGPLLPAPEVRAIIAAQIANFAHGHSGVRPEILRHYLGFLDHDLVPEVPSKGSVGYLQHNAAIALLLIGEGRARVRGARLSGRDALAAIGLQPLTLRAKEGLSLVNGSACATGLSALALARAARLLDWADHIAALTLEAAGCQMAAFRADVIALRPSPGMANVAATLRRLLDGSGLIAAAEGRRTQDALSLRAVPHVHGAARDVFAGSSRVVDQELASVTDNPALSGTPDAPLVSSEAHAVAPALALAADSLSVALAQVAMISERRLDRLINPLVSDLPAFLASDAGSHSGLMIAQYTAAGLVNGIRRQAMPASTDGGITSGLQEDFLANPTAAAAKLLTIVDDAEYVLAIEFLAAAQAHDFREPAGKRAEGTDTLHRRIRALVPPYADDSPLSDCVEAVRDLIRREEGHGGQGEMRVS
nr:histidine ammonia-lyase [uncultured Gellertiella sp.]